MANVNVPTAQQQGLSTHFERAEPVDNATLRKMEEVAAQVEKLMKHNGLVAKEKSVSSDESTTSSSESGRSGVGVTNLEKVRN